MSDCVSNQESPDCPEWKEWVHARKLERDALSSIGVMCVVKTPTGVQPMESSYVYKRKHKFIRSLHFASCVLEICLCII